MHKYINVHWKLTFCHHPPRHHNTTTSALHQHMTDS